MSKRTSNGAVWVVFPMVAILAGFTIFILNYYTSPNTQGQHLSTSSLAVVAGTAVYSQTWTIYGNEHIDSNWTKITEEEFDRIVLAHERTDKAVKLSFVDASEREPGRIIKGTRPNLDGYYYLLLEDVPKDDIGAAATSLVKAKLVYGNSRTGRMVIEFLSTDVLSGALNLHRDKEQYAKEWNRLIKLVEVKRRGDWYRYAVGWRATTYKAASL
jgi:hypothetical protein